MATAISGAAAVDAVPTAAGDDDSVALAARCILEEFDRYYGEFLAIAGKVKAAFEQRRHDRAVQLSQRRLSLYSESVLRVAAQLGHVYALLAHDTQLSDKVESQVLRLVAGRYEEDLVLAFVHSTRREVFKDQWRPVQYSFGAARSSAGGPRRVEIAFPGGACLEPETVRAILRIPGFTRPYSDADADAAQVAERVNRDLGLDGSDPDAIAAIQMIDAGFYRDRSAIIVGRIRLGDGRLLPLVLALVHPREGIRVDAVLTSQADAHNLFSSTLANFHVTSPYYHELAAFLFTILPRRPLGLQYSTIGINHLGKVAVMNELKRDLAGSGEVLRTALGFRGTVAMAFSAPSSNYVLKVIRDRPTRQYKWGTFPGVPAVLDKYDRVHEINRTGSMLDNIIYRNLELDRGLLDPALVEELLEHAGGTVSARGGVLMFKHLIAQVRVIPLPNFLETATPENAAAAIVNLGWCLKNNAAANIFNKDLDGRNYGVGRFLKVFLFDYDAVETLTDVKIRTNRDRVEGEEEAPDWFYEDGVIFLPEEIELGLSILDRDLRASFRAVHADLLTVEYWQGMQAALRKGWVPPITVYPESRRLRDPAPETSLSSAVPYRP